MIPRPHTSVIDHLESIREDDRKQGRSSEPVLYIRSGPESTVSMWPRVRSLITDPRMIAVWLFTAFLVVTFSVVSARPWNDTEVIKTTDSLEECQYFKPDGDILSLNIDDDQVARCVDKIWQKLQKQELKTKKKERKRRRRKNKSLGKKSKKNKRRRRKNKNRQRRPVTRSGATSDSSGENKKNNRRRRQRQRKQRKMFLEQEGKGSLTAALSVLYIQR